MDYETGGGGAFVHCPLITYALDLLFKKLFYDLKGSLQAISIRKLNFLHKFRSSTTFPYQKLNLLALDELRWGCSGVIVDWNLFFKFLWIFLLLLFLATLCMTKYAPKFDYINWLLVWFLYKCIEYILNLNHIMWWDFPK